MYRALRCGSGKGERKALRHLLSIQFMSAGLHNTSFGFDHCLAAMTQDLVGEMSYPQFL